MQHKKNENELEPFTLRVIINEANLFVLLLAVIIIIIIIIISAFVTVVFLLLILEKTNKQRDREREREGERRIRITVKCPREGLQASTRHTVRQAESSPISPLIF